MNKITYDQIVSAYAVSQQVYEGKLNKIDGVEVLSKTHKINQATSSFFIDDFRYLLEGKVYKRIMSSMAVEYFLEKILLDYGLVGLTSAINSLNAHIKYYEKKFKTTAHKLRKILESFESLGEPNVSTVKESDIRGELHRKVKESLESKSTVRKQRLQKADKTPKKRQAISTVYLRNPDVVAEVLLRADGICEYCKKQAPFNRSSDGSPYLEVHHKQQLAKGGEDTVENAMALCPNCHREFHFGA